MIKVTTIVGARPQFIKASLVSRALDELPDMEECLIHTGQHYDDNMSQVFFDEMELRPPDRHLGVGSAAHGAQTGMILQRLEPILQDDPPDVVLVYGDTNSTLAGALAAAKLHIPVAHVEAGMRSFNRRMPEEINRVVADHLSDLLFASTQTAVDNLAREGVAADKIHKVGDVMFDVALYFGRQQENCGNRLAKWEFAGKPYVLATIHRAENTDNPDRLAAIADGLVRVAKKTTVVLPLHPRTRKALEQADLLTTLDQAVQLLDPLGYLDMLALQRSAGLIVTDSGGVQKEAYFHRVPCVTLREETEWVELVQCGCNRLLPPDGAEVIAEGILQALEAGFPESAPADLYGDGTAARQMAAVLVEWVPAACPPRPIRL